MVKKKAPKKTVIIVKLVAPRRRNAPRRVDRVPMHVQLPAIREIREHYNNGVYHPALEDPRTPLLQAPRVAAAAPTPTSLVEKYSVTQLKQKISQLDSSKRTAGLLKPELVSILLQLMREGSGETSAN